MVGNEAPVVTFITPQDGDEFAFGDTLHHLGEVNQRMTEHAGVFA